LASRFDNGSSIKNADGWRTIARPIATRWRWPPDSWPGLRSRYGSSSAVDALQALVDANGEPVAPRRLGVELTVRESS